jgi:alpha-glucosidase (family GH31 glycosyl hydrolase)
MMRPMVLEFPDLEGADVAVVDPAKLERQFMLGPDWLVAPVTAENASSWDAYLPDVSAAGQQWVYWWNQSAAAPPSGWVSVNTTSLLDFPLFVRRAAGGGGGVGGGGPAVPLQQGQR